MVFSFLVIPLSGLCQASYNELGSVSPKISWRLQRIGIIFSLNVWYNSPVKPPGPQVSLERFLNKEFSFFKDKRLFMLSVSS